MSRSQQARLAAIDARRAADDAMVAAHLATKGVTRCPVVAVAETIGAVIPERDRAILQATEVDRPEGMNAAEKHKHDRIAGWKFKRRPIPAELASQPASQVAPARAPALAAPPPIAGFAPEMTDEAWKAATLKAPKATEPDDDDMPTPARKPAAPVKRKPGRYRHLWRGEELLALDTVLGVASANGLNTPPMPTNATAILALLMEGDGWAVEWKASRVTTGTSGRGSRAVEILKGHLATLGILLRPELGGWRIMHKAKVETATAPVTDSAPVSEPVPPPVSVPVSVTVTVGAAAPVVDVELEPAPEKPGSPEDRTLAVAFDLPPNVLAFTSPDQRVAGVEPAEDTSLYSLTVRHPVRWADPLPSESVSAPPAPAPVLERTAAADIADRRLSFTPSPRMWERMRAHAAATFREGGPELSPEQIMEEALLRFLDMEEAGRALREPVKAARWWM